MNEKKQLTYKSNPRVSYRAEVEEIDVAMGELVTKHSWHELKRWSNKELIERVMELEAML